MFAGFIGVVGWLTPHFDHRVPSLCKECGSARCGMGGCGGGTYAILRHIVCESGGRRRVEGKGCRGGWGEGKGDRMGLNTHVAKFPTEFIEGRGSGHRRRERKRWVDGLSLPFLCCF